MTLKTYKNGFPTPIVKFARCVPLWKSPCLKFSPGLSRFQEIKKNNQLFAVERIKSRVVE